MDSLFGIGLPELILILVIAGIVMGPERIGRTARWLGRTTAQLQAISRTFVRQLNAELDESNELRGTWQDMQDLRRQLDDLKGELAAVAGSAYRDGKAPLKAAAQELERTIAPPSFADGSQETASEALDRQEPVEDAPVSTLPKRVHVADDPEPQ